MTVRHRGALGIKTADGGIVPVLDFSSQRSSQTIFTTVRDRQNKVVFDFYYREERTGGWVYLDSLPLSHIPPAPAGEPELRVRTQVDTRGNLSLQIQDPAASKPFSFVLTAETLGRLGQEVQAARTPAEIGQEKVRKGRRIWLLVLALITVLCVVSVFLLDLNPLSVLRRSDTHSPENVRAETVTRPSSDRPPAGIEAGAAHTSTAQAKGLEEPIVRSAAEIGKVVETPQEEQKEEHLSATKAGDSGEYLITWGDTLWRITERFYGNRDLYPALADVNRLPDPNVIIAGKTLRLPPLEEKRASSYDEDRTSR